MKIIKFLLSILVSCIIFASCNTMPSDISSAHYTYAQKAIEIVDEYLDFNITVEEAYEKISELHEREETLPDTDYDDPTHANDFSIEATVSIIDFNLFQLKLDPSSDEQSELLENRNELAELIGAKKK